MNVEKSGRELPMKQAIACPAVADDPCETLEARLRDGVPRRWPAPLPEAVRARLDEERAWLRAKPAVWPRAAQPKLLTPREVALARISGRAAAGDMPGLKRACAEGLAAGLTVNEIKEVFVQLYAYLGFPRSLNANNAFAQLLAERKAAGTVDPEGPAPKTLPADADRERIGREKRAALWGSDPNAPAAAWQTFAPGAEQFLKEHLFCDVFARGLLTDKERELCTVSMLCVLPGAEPQLASHRAAAEHMGNTKAALDEAVDLARDAR